MTISDRHLLHCNFDSNWCLFLFKALSLDESEFESILNMFEDQIEYIFNHSGSENLSFDKNPEELKMSFHVIEVSKKIAKCEMA